MKIISIIEAYKRKFERQSKIKELEYDAAGHCVHIGKLSPGCYYCFSTTNIFRYNISSGAKCNLSCPYCYFKDQTKEPSKEKIHERKIKIIVDSLLSNYNPLAVSFSGGGEPLLYMDFIVDYMKLLREIERQTKKRPWYYLYTNGVRADINTVQKLKDLGFDEIRFHLGATNFSQLVYKHMKYAARHFKTITVETPAWPLHRKKLFEMLPIIEDIGVKHLNIGEIEITRFNYKKICRFIPDAEFFHCYQVHLDDGGLVYDIIEEIVRKKYSYSVLDCNCFVKSFQRAPARWAFYQGPLDVKIVAINKL